MQYNLWSKADAILHVGIFHHAYGHGSKVYKTGDGASALSTNFCVRVVSNTKNTTPSSYKPLFHKTSALGWNTIILTTNGWYDNIIVSYDAHGLHHIANCLTSIAKIFVSSHILFKWIYTVTLHGEQNTC